MAVAINHRKQASFVIRHSAVLSNELRSLQVASKALLIPNSSKVGCFFFWGGGKFSEVG